MHKEAPVLTEKVKYPPKDIQERTFQFGVRVVKTVKGFSTQ
jgi:hypothetical protein